MGGPQRGSPRDWKGLRRRRRWSSSTSSSSGPTSPSGPGCCPASGRAGAVGPLMQAPTGSPDVGQLRRAGPCNAHRTGPSADRRRRGRRLPVKGSWGSLRGQVRSLRRHPGQLGVPASDQVAGYLPNVQAIVAFLGMASIGAVWSSCAPGLGTASSSTSSSRSSPCAGRRRRLPLQRQGVRPAGRRRQPRAALPTVTTTIAVPGSVPRRAARRGLWPEPGRRREASMSAESWRSTTRCGSSTHQEPLGCRRGSCTATAGWRWNARKTSACT